MDKISVRLLMYNVVVTQEAIHEPNKRDGEKCQKAKLDMLQGHAEWIMTDDMNAVFPVNTGDE